MKPLFDQNISFRLISKISKNFPKAKQVRQLGIENFPDEQIWSFAKENDYTIVTFDSDFFDLSNLNGHPPKIIWLRFGNTTTENLSAVLNAKADIIQNFIDNKAYREIACLELK